jgi:hypothetical protein
MDESQKEKFARLTRLKADAEAAYDKMYNVYTDTEIRLQFDLAEDFLLEASRISRELGMEEEHQSIMVRYQHIRDVYRGQFRRST